MYKLLFLFLLVSSSAVGQDLFNVRVGSFKDVKADDFTNLQKLGFLYGAQRADQVTDVYLGNFSTENQATKIATDLQKQGFRNAQAFALPTATGTQVTVIQLALHSGSRPIDWPALERAGELYVESVDGTNKIVTGIYPSIEVANQFLPAIRDLGYSDAFVKKINNVRLVPVGVFETGIKKPLIPLELQQANTEVQLSAPATNAAPATPPAPTTYGGTPASASPTPAATMEAKAPAAATATMSLPAPAKVTGLPTIDGRTKRHSAAELQRVLKEKGYYDGSIDGYYGPATTKSYLAAWDDMPEIRKYRQLTNTQFASSASQGNSPSNWPEVKVLMSISEDMAAGLANSERARDMAQQRPNLFNAREALTPVAATRARNWAATTWTNINNWAIEDPLHAQMVSALRVAYHQSQVRMENMFSERGLRDDEARDLATATVQNLIGAQLDRFL